MRSADGLVMSSSPGITALREVLIDQYEDLKKQLAQRLGSEDLAGEVLQETYLQLERPLQVAVVRSPKQYLLTIATNIARMTFRRERRQMSLTDLDAALGFVDEMPDPLRNLEARQEFEVLKRAFDELSPRRRQILIAARIEGVRLRDIAQQLGLSQRAIEKELKAALVQCAVRLNRDIVQRFGPRPREASANGEDAAAAAEADDE
jgi:RNA polymerase sigma-70 factor (ECF subfamily)